MSEETKKETTDVKFPIIEKIQKAADTYAVTLNEYKEKYIVNNIENGKKFIEERYEKISKLANEYNEKYVAENIKTGKEFIEERYEKISKLVNEYNEKYIAANIKTGKEFINEHYEMVVKLLNEYNEKYLAKYIKTGKEFVEVRYQKVTKLAEELKEKGMEKGKQIKEKFPMVDNIESKISDTLGTIPSIINMPGKKDIEKLTLAMEALNTNVETLNKQYAA